MEFNNAVNIVLKHEGGHVNDDRDPGGETKFGISKRSYPNEDIKNLTKARAREIYFDDYWVKMKCDEMPPQCRLLLFDGAVNHGVGFMSLILQRALGVTADGVIGPVTIGAAKNISADRLAIRLAQARAQIYRKNRNFFVYGRGWLNRLVDVVYRSR